MIKPVPLSNTDSMTETQSPKQTVYYQLYLSCLAIIKYCKKSNEGRAGASRELRGEELKGDAAVKANSMSQNELRGERKEDGGEKERKARHAEICIERRVNAVPQMPWLRSSL